MFKCIWIFKLFNRIWKERKIPKNWKSALVFPIVKPGKDPTNPKRYGPIALTSIVYRLSFYLEHNNMISQYQCGFRKGISAMDALTKFSNHVEKALVLKENVITVYFDIEKSLWYSVERRIINQVTKNGDTVLWQR